MITEKQFEDFIEKLELIGENEVGDALIIQHKDYYKIAFLLSDFFLNSNDRMMRIEEVVYMTLISKTVIYEKIANGTFPDQYTIKGSSAGKRWRMKNIQEWIADPEKWVEKHKEDKK